MEEDRRKKIEGQEENKNRTGAREKQEERENRNRHTTAKQQTDKWNETMDDKRGNRERRRTRKEGRG